MAAVATLARLTLMRLVRGKTIWVSGLLVLVPLAIAAMTLARVDDAAQRWVMVGELTMRSLVLLAPVLHLAPAIGEENEGKTYTYLWSRPVARPALLFGKVLAIAPVIALVTAAALTVAWLIVGLGPGELEPVWLLRTVGASTAGIAAASCFAVGVGSLVPRYPLVVSLGYIFFAEQVLPMIQAVQNVSVLYHVQNIAGLPHGPPVTEEPGTALIALAVLAAVWMGIAVWRVNRLEFGAPDS